MCDKKRYPSRVEARHELRRCRKDARRTERALYLCMECGYWHLTSRLPGEPQRPVSHFFRKNHGEIKERYEG